MNSETIIISEHAIERFIERQPSEKIKVDDPEKQIRKILKKSFRIKFSPKYQALRLLNNDITEAEYWYNSGWIMIVVDNKIVTCERQDDKKFGRDIFRYEEKENQ